VVGKEMDMRLARFCEFNKPTNRVIAVIAIHTPPTLNKPTPRVLKCSNCAAASSGESKRAKYSILSNARPKILKQPPPRTNTKTINTITPSIFTTPFNIKPMAQTKDTALKLQIHIHNKSSRAFMILQTSPYKNKIIKTKAYPPQPAQGVAKTKKKQSAIKKPQAGGRGA